MCAPIRTRVKVCESELARISQWDFRMPKPAHWPLRRAQKRTWGRQ